MGVDPDGGKIREPYKALLALLDDTSDAPFCIAYIHTHTHSSNSSNTCMCVCVCV